MGTLPANDEGGLQKVRITGILPENRDGCTSDIIITTRADGEPVAHHTETVEVVQ